MMDLTNIWDYDLLWDTFAFILRIAAPFLMIIIAIIGVGMLLKAIVGAVKKGAER